MNEASGATGVKGGLQEQDAPQRGCAGCRLAARCCGRTAKCLSSCANNKNHVVYTYAWHLILKQLSQRRTTKAVMFHVCHLIPLFLRNCHKAEWRCLRPVSETLDRHKVSRGS